MVPKMIQSRSMLIQLKTDLPEVENFGIKHGWKVLELRNNFHYWNFFRFERDFELKFGEASKVQIQLEFNSIFF
jgi:hypothetical protein